MIYPFLPKISNRSMLKLFREFPICGLGQLISVVLMTVAVIVPDGIWLAVSGIFLLFASLILALRQAVIRRESRSRGERLF